MHYYDHKMDNDLIHVISVNVKLQYTLKNPNNGNDNIEIFNK